MITLKYLKSIEQYEPVISGHGLLWNGRRFKFKGFTLLSAGIGTSADHRIMKICTDHSSGHDGKFNTWYFNDGDKDFDHHDAKKIFHHLPVKDNPIWNWSSKPFEPIRDQLSAMVEVAEKYGYLAMGCDGNAHRGPSVFAMFLSLAGVHPKESTKIANELFGKNWVMPFVRQKIANLGYEYGNKHPELRARLQKLI